APSPSEMERGDAYDELCFFFFPLSPLVERGPGGEVSKGRTVRIPKARRIRSSVISSPYAHRHRLPALPQGAPLRDPHLRSSLLVGRPPQRAGAATSPAASPRAL